MIRTGARAGALILSRAVVRASFYHWRTEPTDRVCLARPSHPRAKPRRSFDVKRHTRETDAHGKAHLGKPIGNGHPLAAVITTPEIAASFDTGMEYFNTFGGNPVSCEIGLAVLEVVQEEGLQENARVVGEYLMAGLRDLMTAHQLIGDVRGAGLFVGVELVRDHDTLEPAAQEASLVVEGMKDSGVLMSTDGPLRNVLKIKPPMVFNQSNAARLVETLDRVLREVVS